MSLDLGELVATMRIDEDPFQRNISSIQRTMQRVDGSDLTVEVHADTKKASFDLKTFTQDVSSGFGDAGARISKVMTIAGAAGPAIMLVGSALSAAAAGGVAVAGALGPAAAAGLAVYVGGLMAIQQGALVAKFAMDGVAEAAGGDEKAMKALSPEGQRLARTLHGLQPELEGVRRQAQKGMFPGLDFATQRLAKAYLPDLRNSARLTGNELGSLARQGAVMASSGPWRRDFSQVTQYNAYNIGIMGRAGLQLADAARSLIVTGQPVFRMFLNWAGGAAEAVNAFIQAKRESGELQRFWNGAYESGALLAHILGNLAAGLFHIFQIGGSGQGKSMLTNLEGMTDQFNQWTKSAGGRTKIVAWFAEGRRNLDAMGRLIGAVAHGLSGIGSGAQFAPLVDEIRTKVLPPLMEFLHNASASGALNALVDAVGSLLGVLAKLSQHDGSLKAFAHTLEAVGDASAWIIDNVPGAGAALGAFFTVAGSAAALRFLGLGGVVTALGNGMLILAGKMGIATGTTVANTAAMWVASGASKAWAATQWLLNAALTANPIGLVVVAVALLVGGLIFAWKHSETFRNIVKGAFDAVGKAGKWMWEGVLKPVFAFIIGAWLNVAGWIINGAAKAFGWVPGLGPKLKAAAKWFNTFKEDVNRQLDGIKDKKEIKITTPGASTAISNLATIKTLMHDISHAKPAHPVKGGGNLSTLLSPGHNARGTAFWGGGPTWLHEQGPEIVDLPTGSRVYPAGKSAQMMREEGGGGRPIIVNDRSGDPTRTAREVVRLEAFAGGG